MTTLPGLDRGGGKGSGGSRIFPRRGPANLRFKEKSMAAIFFYIGMLRPKGGNGTPGSPLDVPIGRGREGGNHIISVSRCM